MRIELAVSGLRLTFSACPSLQASPGALVAIDPLQESMHMKTEIEIDLGLARVSDSALAMLEGKTGAADLPPDLFSRLLDALGEEHLRRFAARRGAAAVLRVPARTLDADELWHSLRMLGNWLSTTDETPAGDPDVAAVREVIARMWVGVRGALDEFTDEFFDVTHQERRN
jgi:hypothetical protein